MEKENYKAAYRLYWKYLKRSELYKDFCTWYPKWRKDQGEPPFDLILPDKFTEKDEDLSVPHPVFFLHQELFGDIHSGNFEEWWGKNWVNIESEGTPFKTRWKTSAVSDASDHVLEYYDNFVSFCEEIHGRPPTIDEIRGMLKRRLTTDSQYIYKAIRVETAKTKVTIRLSKAKKQRQVYLNFRRSISGGLSLTRLDKNALKSYLLVYDAYLKPHENGETRTFADVALEIGSKEEKMAIRYDPNDKAVCDTYYTKNKTAKKLIKNAERGHFPCYK